MKKLFMVIIILAALLFGFVFTRNIIVKTVLIKGIKAIAGVDIEVGKVNIGLTNTLIGINNLKIFNPAGSVDKIMADFPEIYVDYDLGAFFKKQVHLENLKLDLKELVIVQDAKRQVNVNSLKALLPKQSSKPAPEIKIDELSLRIGKVIYKDYSSREPSVREFNLNIDEHYKNITDPKSLVSTILARALMNIGIPNINIADLKKSAAQNVESAKSLVAGQLEGIKSTGQDTTGAAKEAVKETADSLKQMFKF